MSSIERGIDLGRAAASDGRPQQRYASAPVPADGPPSRPPIGRRSSVGPVPEPGRGFDALAAGELGPDEAAGLRTLKERILHHLGFQCNAYKERCLRRRIAVRMRARGVHEYEQYAELIDADVDERQRLLDAVTINVSKFFRNADAWALLRAHVVPRLFGLDAPVINIWSAGSAAGEEPYSLAVLLLEHAARSGQDVSRFRILATDVDARALELARAGEYPDFAFTETPADVRRRWFVGPDTRRVRPELQRLVRFEPHDLLRDPFPTSQHLILCRNVVIYFERHVQETVFEGFHRALAPDGHLLLGKVEALFGRVATRFRPVSTRERLFQKP